MIYMFKNMKLLIHNVLLKKKFTVCHISVDLYGQYIRKNITKEKEIKGCRGFCASFFFFF